jgi:hypothetical protein
MLEDVNMHQIAFAARTDEDERMIKRMLNLRSAEWVEDEVVAEGQVNGRPGRNRAKLLFNYDYGREIEILRYLEGPNYLDAAGIKSGQICHIGMHYEGTGKPNTFAAPIMQQVVTQSHTNEYVLGKGLHYRYSIYDTRPELGVFMKVIERIHPTGGSNGSR